MTQKLMSSVNYSGDGSASIPFDWQLLQGASTQHYVDGTQFTPPFAEHLDCIALGLGCFWGAERAFWQLDGVVSTAVGYGGGEQADPDYKTVCNGATGHVELVLVIFDASKISIQEILKVFWEKHDPTQGMRQGNDIGSQYRSAIYWMKPKHEAVALKTLKEYEKKLLSRSYGAITTEIKPLNAFYYAESYHQQYLAKNPGGYCGLGGTGVTCTI
ncbi:MAG: peptide-methionine (S)-S-oxide reductase MsrA [Oleiphilaceae bacterium]|nr:peptide-methionine (S)-S-oxide reductase MsrA [Oleiphilaceae bacterium]